MNPRAILLLLSGVVISGCSNPEPAVEPEPEETVLVSACSERLIGLETVYCREDVVGPGTLTVRIRPDPKETSWELGIRGLAALAEACAFEGRFDGTRLSRLQGRGAVAIVCPIAADVDRPYHEISFENRLDAPNTSIQVSFEFRR